MAIKANNRTGCFLATFLLALPVAGLLWIFASTQRRMEEYRTRIVPGMTVEQLKSFAGRPDVIVRRGETLYRARRSYVVPELDEHTALYFFPREGIPYFNVYVYVDAPQGVVIRADVENLGW